ncbi:hypothetical protein [Mucilaginibacter ximonensis]
MQIRAIMKNLGRILFTLAMLCFGGKLYAQETVNKGDIVIHIHGSGPDFLNKFQLDIYKRSDSMKIVYAVFDSIRFSVTRKDSAFARLSAKYWEGKGDSAERRRLSDAVSAYFERNSVYDRDSITIAARQDTAYNALLQRLGSASKEDLLQTGRNKNRFLIDGVHFGFAITSASGYKAVGVRSPSANSHPLL